MADRIDTVIEDATLRRLARAAAEGEAVPVLIEVDVPTAARPVAIPRPRGVIGGAVTAVVDTIAGAPAADTARAVAKVFGRSPQYLAAAGAYAAAATGAQLAALAATPTVRAIRPDRALPLR